MGALEFIEWKIVLCSQLQMSPEVVQCFSQCMAVAAVRMPEGSVSIDRVKAWAKMAIDVVCADLQRVIHQDESDPSG